MTARQIGSSVFSLQSSVFSLSFARNTLAAGSINSGSKSVAGAIGFGYGLLFWLGMRNLWPLIVAHAIPDTISLIGIYQGG